MPPFTKNMKQYNRLSFSHFPSNVRILTNISSTIYVHDFSIGIPHWSIFLDDSTDKGVSYDIYNDEYEENHCYDNSGCVGHE